MTEQQHEPGFVDDVDVAQLAADISRVLTDLDVYDDLVHELADTHQRGLGFLTPTARIAQDKAIRAEKDARVDTDERALGLDWMRRPPNTRGAGQTRAAANDTPLSVQAEITFTITHLTRRVVRALDRAGVCAMSRLPGDPTTRQRINHLRQLVYAAPSRPLLASVLADLDHVAEAAARLVDGDDRAELGDPCPWCDRRTLVVQFANGVIRCDRDPKTGHYEICRCRDPYCTCKHKPMTFRHEWHRDRGTKPDSWWSLSDRLDRVRTEQAGGKR